MKENVICSRCGDVIEGDSETVNGKIICLDCAEDFCVRCHDCGELMYSANDYGDSTISLCKSCFEHDYKRCSKCNRLIKNEDSRKLNNRYYCSFCYEKFGRKCK